MRLLARPAKRAGHLRHLPARLRQRASKRARHLRRAAARKEKQTRNDPAAPTRLPVDAGARALLPDAVAHHPRPPKSRDRSSRRRRTARAPPHPRYRATEQDPNAGPGRPLRSSTSQTSSTDDRRSRSSCACSSRNVWPTRPDSPEPTGRGSTSRTSFPARRCSTSSPGGLRRSRSSSGSPPVEAEREEREQGMAGRAGGADRGAAREARSRRSSPLRMLSTHDRVRRRRRREGRNARPRRRLRAAMGQRRRRAGGQHDAKRRPSKTQPEQHRPPHLLRLIAGETQMHHPTHKWVGMLEWPYRAEHREAHARAGGLLRAVCRGRARRVLRGPRRVSGRLGRPGRERARARRRRAGGRARAADPRHPPAHRGAAAHATRRRG